MRSDKEIHSVLRSVRRKKLSLKSAAKRLKGLPSSGLEFAKIDCGRYARCGLPEVIYCEGKSVAQIKRIAKEMLAREDFLLLTRLPEREYKILRRSLPRLKYNRLGRIAYYPRKDKHVKTNKSVLIITAGTSDIPVAEEARTTLEIMGGKVQVIYDVGVAGIHRLFNITQYISESNVIIVIAGMEGALASVVSGLASKPVIAVPTSCGYGASFEGVTPLLAMLNSCAPGVAVVNIDNGFGAACVANLINNT